MGYIKTETCHDTRGHQQKLQGEKCSESLSLNLFFYSFSDYTHLFPHTQETTHIIFLFIQPEFFFMKVQENTHVDFYISPILYKSNILYTSCYYSIHYFKALCCFHSIIYLGNLSESVYRKVPHSFCKHLRVYYIDMPLLIQ